MSKWDELEVLLIFSTMIMGVISTQPDPIFQNLGPPSPVYQCKTALMSLSTAS